jgi:hypothetical protein
VLPSQATSQRNANAQGNWVLGCRKAIQDMSLILVFLRADCT